MDVWECICWIALHLLAWDFALAGVWCDFSYVYGLAMSVSLGGSGLAQMQSGIAQEYR